MTIDATLPPMMIQRPCAGCAAARLSAPGRRFGGRRVCPECWAALTRLERAGGFRGYSRANLIALFAAEVAIRQPRRPPLVADPKPLHSL